MVWTRSTSWTARSTFQEGRTAIGYSRPPELSWSSAIASLNSWTHSRRSSSSGTRLPNRSPPSPTLFGNTMCAQIPSRSMSFEPGGHVVGGGDDVLDTPVEQDIEAQLLAPVPADRRSARRPPERSAIDDPGGLAVDLLDPGHPVTPPRRCPRGPQIVRLGPVGVGVDDLDASEGARTVRSGGHPASFPPPSQERAARQGGVRARRTCSRRNDTSGFRRAMRRTCGLPCWWRRRSGSTPPEPGHWARRQMPESRSMTGAKTAGREPTDATK